MAKINRFLVEYTNAVRHSGITPDTSRPPKAVIRRFVRLFKNVEDTRIDAMTDYPLVEIILIAFLAVLANASTWEEIAQFGRSKQRWLKKFLQSAARLACPVTDTGISVLTERGKWNRPKIWVR